MLFILSVVVVVVAFFAWQTAKKRMLVNAMYRTTSNIALVVMVFFAIVALSQCFAVVPAGHVGVVDFLGTVNDRPLPAGVNIVNPFARIHKYSVQTKEHKETMRVLSREGLTIELEISVLYRLNPDSAARVYQSIVGGDYEGVVLVPQFRSISRSVTASFQASALYSTEREQLGISILAELAKAVAARGVIVESTPLRNVGLPSQLTEAIEQKQRADQESQRMQFVLTKEKQEADRKRIEAQGIADFQTIVSRGLNNQLLTWKGIEATEKLANSQNTKVIVIGGGKTGLPLILDTK